MKLAHRRSHAMSLSNVDLSIYSSYSANFTTRTITNGAAGKALGSRPAGTLSAQSGA
jgi:hypothetical protein